MSLARSRLVAAISRTFTASSRVPPSRRNVLVSSTFRSLGCSSGTSSPISSRKMVPPSASSNKPCLRSLASVNAPFSCPNSSESRNVADRPPQFTSTNGPRDRGLNVPLTRQENDRRALRAQPLEHLEAAHVGEVQVEDHHVGAEPLERRHAPLSRVLARHLVAEALEVVPDGAYHIGVVVDQEQGLSHGGPRSPRGRPAAGAPRTACPPRARRRAASAAPHRRVPRPAPPGPDRTTPA